MQGNKPKTDDDFEDAIDLDASDLEAETDFADDSWDELDEDSAKGPDKSAGAPAKKKSSSKKFLNFIIIAAVMAGGGYFILKRFVLQSPEALQADAGAEGGQPGIVELADGSSPPMPAPIDSGADTPDISEPPANPAPETLTPLPETQQLENVQLGSLDTPAPAPEAPSAEAPIPVQGEIAPPAEAAPVEPVASESGVLPVPQAEAIPAPVPVRAQPDPAVTARIDALEQNLASLRSDIEQKSVSTNQKLDPLAGAISSVSSKLDETARVAEKAEKIAAEKPAAPAPAPKAEPQEEPPVAANENPAPAAPPAEKPQQEEVARAPAAEPAPAASAPAAASTQRTTQWVLRSAQPGRASVSAKGSNELKTIVTGDSLEGVGKILSIDLEGGVWTVKGTKGFITR